MRLSRLARNPSPLRQAVGVAALSLLFTDIPAETAIRGIEGEAAKNVELSLSLAREQCDASRWMIERLFDKADAEIDEAARAFGYYHAAVKKSLSFDDACWHAKFDISPGPRTIVNEIRITLRGEAESDPAFRELRDKLAAEKNQPLRHDRYEKMKNEIKSLATATGYLNGSFSESRLIVDPATNTATFRLSFDSKNRLRFGDVNVEQDILDPEFVRKFIAFKPGDFYSSDALGKTYDALSRSGYFEQIDIRPSADVEHRQNVPVSVRLTPKKVHHYSLGLGFATDVGPLVTAAYQSRRLNRSGHFLNANLDISQVLSTADIEYNIPLAKPTTDFFSFGAGFKREDTDTFESRSGKLSARLKHAYDNGWKQTLFLDWVYEDFRIGATQEEVVLLIPGGNWLRSVSNDPLRPTEGYRLEFNLTGSYENPLSEVSFAQGSVAAVWRHQLPWGGIFLGRAEQGATLVDNFDKLPPSYRFYAGGMNSIRGYDYKELGPRDRTGAVIGGRYLSVLSAEYEHPILDNWGLAAFIDAGDAYNSEGIDVKVGTGLGVRWYSPIGPIRLDFAVPLNEAESSFQVHFAAGMRL
ncbi:autotransporter assembly complex protein TamA [Methylomicrobium album]|uniref:Translocation and assembly module subunit TamA n=1 Tax=Methylomicrobium album BG8 TaxID=686340 RepID=H8GM81_METAL|nr:autotransporter assembly complex family protein [Methylomicrobium album]EIC29442.1 outer membrane protein [Methylomicrobium album BG8]